MSNAIFLSFFIVNHVCVKYIHRELTIPLCKIEREKWRFVPDLWPNVLINLISLVGNGGPLLCGLNAAICRWRRVICTRQSSAISMGSPPPLDPHAYTLCHGTLCTICLLFSARLASAGSNGRLSTIRYVFTAPSVMKPRLWSTVSVNFLRNAIQRVARRWKFENLNWLSFQISRGFERLKIWKTRVVPRI